MLLGAATSVCCGISVFLGMSSLMASSKASSVKGPSDSTVGVLVVVGGGDVGATGSRLAVGPGVTTGLA